MNKTNLELFKQALDEAVSNQFDKLAAQCDEEIICSEKHKLAMRAIVYGKTETAQTLSPKMKRLIAILVAASLLLTGCAIIFRNEIREVFEEFFVSLTYSGDEETLIIQEVYSLGYVPEGYVLEKETIAAQYVRYRFSNQVDFFYFEQRPITNSDYYIDSESGYSQINEIEEYKIYYRLVDNLHCYVWRDNNYSIKMKTSVQLSNEELILILDGISVK